MYFDFTRSTFSSYGRVGSQVLHLLQYVFFDSGVLILMPESCTTFDTCALTHNHHGRTTMPQPLFNVRQPFNLTSIQSTGIGTTICVATNNNISYFQYRYSVFNGRSSTTRLITMRWYNVTNVTKNK